MNLGISVSTVKNRSTQMSSGHQLGLKTGVTFIEVTQKLKTFVSTCECKIPALKLCPHSFWMHPGQKLNWLTTESDVLPGTSARHPCASPGPSLPPLFWSGDPSVPGTLPFPPEFLCLLETSIPSAGQFKACHPCCGPCASVAYCLAPPPVFD